MQEICPICGSKEIKLVDKNEKKYKCLACDDVFILQAPTARSIESEIVTKINETKELSAKEVYNQNIDSIIEVACTFGDQCANGTGFYISKDGYFITNAHVVLAINGKNTRLCDRAYISKSRATNFLDAEVVYLDPKNDLALLKVLKKKDFKPVKIATGIEIGDKLVVIGNSAGQGLMLLDGIVGDLNRKYKNTTAFIFNALVTHGCSGGPIFNTQGKLCGVTAAGSRAAAGMNYGISIETLKIFIDKAQKEKGIKL